MVHTRFPNANGCRDRNRAAVAVTTGIMRILSREKLEGVLAQCAMIFGGRSSDESEHGNPIASLIMMIVGPIATKLVQMAISRLREYGADAGGAKISGNPLNLANTLKQLQMASQRVPMDAILQPNMFIVNPLSGGGLLKLFSTRPPIEERVAKLETMIRGK